MTEETHEAPAEPSRDDEGPWSKLAIGLLATPGIPWVFLERSEKVERFGWWLKLTLGVFWLYAVTCLIAGIFGIWALYVRKQSRDDAIVYGDDKAAAFWGNLIVGGFWLSTFSGAFFGLYFLYTRLELGDAVIATLLFGILVALVALYDQRAKVLRK